MPSKDWYQSDTGLNRTMCPKCGEDSHFTVTAKWNVKDEDRSARRFSRHLYPSNRFERDIQPILHDDSTITCGSCGNTFPYLEGRDTYAKFEEDTVNSFLIPSTPSNPWIVASDKYYNGSLCYPVSSYDAFGGRGIGNRQTHLFTSSIYLNAHANACDTPSWRVQIPYREGHTNRYSEGNGSVSNTDLFDISVPPKIDPYLTKYFSRLLYLSMLVLRHEDEEDATPFRIPGRGDEDRIIEISTDEADDILNTMIRLKEHGDRCIKAMRTSMDNSNEFNLVETTDGQIAMYCAKAKKSHKMIARSMQIPLIEFKSTSFDYSYSSWCDARKADSRVRKRTGDMCLYWRASSY